MEFSKILKKLNLSLMEKHLAGHSIIYHLRPLPCISISAWNKAENISAFVALAKTAPGARIGEDHESRGARIGVERAKTGVILAGFAQFHALRHQINDVDARFDFVNCGHGYSLSGCQRRNGTIDACMSKKGGCRAVFAHQLPGIWAAGGLACSQTEVILH